MSINDLPDIPIIPTDRMPHFSRIGWTHFGDYTYGDDLENGVRQARRLYGSNNVAMGDHTDGENIMLFVWRNVETGYAFLDDDDR